LRAVIKLIFETFLQTNSETIYIYRLNKQIFALLLLTCVPKNSYHTPGRGRSYSKGLMTSLLIKWINRIIRAPKERKILVLEDLKMVVGVHRRAVGVFTNRRDAEAALHELKKSGFDMNRVSVVVQDADGDRDIAGAAVTERVGDKSDEGATVGAVSGGTLGGLTGLLVGLGTLAIPGIGPIMLAGATATALATTLAGAGIGALAGSLLGGLIGLGIPEERARVYNDRVQQGQYLVILDGTDAEIAEAEKILHTGGVEEFGIYDHPNSPPITSGVATRDVGVASVAATPVVSASLHRKRAIGVFSHRRDAEAAIGDLRDGGISLDHVSIIGKNADHNLAGVGLNDRVEDTKADDGAKAGAVTGGALGGLGGLLVGLGTLAIPGVGPVLLGGAAATALATALTGGAIGAAAGSIAGGLVGLGIPEKNAKIYHDRIDRGDYLVIVDGTDAEIHRAEEILKTRHVEEFNIYDATDLDRASDRSVVTQPTPVVNTTQTNYVPPTTVDRDEASVIIIDRRDERV
jgi:hypothetical protein